MNKQEFEFVLSKGEDFKTEFKENLSGIEKDIVAFSNADGGIILIGVSDDKKLKGLTITNKLKAEIQNIARDCDPSINVEINEYENILVVAVPESLNKPHRCSSGFYLRIGPISQKLSVDEIRELFNKQGKILYEEMTNKEFTLKDFNANKFKEYLTKAKISMSLSQADLLRNLGLTTEKGEFKNAAILMFSKDVDRFIPQGIITCVLYKGTNKVFIIDRKDFKSDIVTNYTESINFLYRHLNLRYEIKGFGPRKEILDIPEEALKEAVVNAICHRDYAEKGAVVQIDVFDDRVEISNPGGLIIKESEFGKRSLSRNPLIFSLLQRIELVEHVGSGIERMRKAMSAVGLPEPRFEFGKFFSILFYRQIKNKTEEELGETGGVKGGLNGGVKGELNIAYNLISNNPGLRLPHLAKLLKKPERTVEKWLEKLKSENKIEFRGSSKTGGYYKK